MVRGINKVILIGNLGRDPETRMTTDGRAVCNISVATTKSWRDRGTNEQKERTEWHRVVFFNRLAEIAGEYLRKGSKIYLEGELQTRDWERDGQKHYTTEIVAREMQMLDSKGDASSSFPDTGGSEDAAQPSAPDTSAPAAPQSGMDSSSGEDFDDDIPF